MMRSGNPALSNDVFVKSRSGNSSGVMTLEGTVNKCIFGITIILLSASYTWHQYFGGESVAGLMMLGGIGGFVVALVTIFKKEWAAITVPIYALLKGLFLGGISATFEARFPGIVIQAVGLTFGVFFALLFAYKSKLIQATENFKLGVTAATGGIALFYLVSIILGFFGIRIPFVHESGIIGIGFSLFVVVVAALNLVMDFDFIEEGANQRAAKHMEWFGTFGLLVTLIWLYLEMLHLLAKLKD